MRRFAFFHIIYMLAFSSYLQGHLKEKMEEIAHAVTQILPGLFLTDWTKANRFYDATVIPVPALLWWTLYFHASLLLFT